jgi:membrane protein
MEQSGAPAAYSARESRWRSIKGLLVQSFEGLLRHNGPRLGAALAFYALLSLTPLVLIAVSIGAWVFGEKAAEGELFYQINDLAGPEGALAIQAMLKGAHDSTHGVLATLVGVVTLLFAASAVLIELRQALNDVWDIPTAKTTPWQGVVSILRERLFAFVLVLAIGFLLLVSLLVNTGIAAVAALFPGGLPISVVALHIVNAFISLAVTSILFAVAFKVIPDVRLKWRDVIAGAAVTSILFTLGKFLIGLYVGEATFASTYGAAASFVVLMLWFYYSAQIFFFGAEFTRSFANTHGSRSTVRLPGSKPDR